MKEHPILFSTPMVQAILEGRKTQTRRTTNLKTVNEKPEHWELMGLELDAIIKIYKNFFLFKEKLLKGVYAQFRKFKTEDFCYCHCPYGQPGDRLWVRETFEYLDRGTDDNGWDGYLRYVADEKEIRYPSQDCSPKRMPSIHMPKAAARIWLEIEEVKVERLQDISEEDAKAEGIKSYFSVLFNEERYNDYLDFESEYRSPSSSFMSLWLKINGNESWNSNPWVWVVKFKVISTTGIHSITQ